MRALIQQIYDGRRFIGELVGLTVIIRNLTNRVELNGETATVASYDSSKKRYVVSVAGRPQPMLFKADNLYKITDEAGTPLTTAVMMGSIDGLEICLSQMIDAAEWVDRPDPNTLITPLMGCAFCDDDDNAVGLACRLLTAGAKVDTPDATAGSTPAFMAAQEGKPKLLQMLINRRAHFKFAWGSAHANNANRNRIAEWPCVVRGRVTRGRGACCAPPD